MSRVAVAVCLLLTIVPLSGGCGSSSSSTDTGRPGVDRFSSARAWNLVKRQLSYGQRPAGSPQLRRLATRLRPLLPRGRFEPVPGEPGLRNVVGTISGGSPAS